MSKFKQVLLAIAIAIVFAFFIGFGIAAFYESPKYENFCGEREYKNFQTEEECDANNGKWTERGPARLLPIEAFEKPIPLDAPDSNRYVCTVLEQNDENKTFHCQTVDEIQAQGSCDAYFYCRKEFDDVREIYNRNVFMIATVIGIIALVAGIVLKITSVSSGLMGGGILLIIYGIIRYWSGLENYGRFTVMGIALTVLIWLGYKKLKS
ncbi:MAG: hypothetical protein IIB81_01930 [Nanoarchaeota archaeon]|nr:hypothetical protein [Nanoarchaeota archaeon]